MKKLVSVVTLGLVLAVLAGTASAQQVQVRTARAYGTAGCGLGSMIFGSKPGIIQIFAATTNGTFGTQTFGITSGTSNCVDSEEPMVGTASFIQTNREILAKDISRGSGETIVTLSTLAGCRDSRTVGRTLQSRFQVIFPRPHVSDQEVSNRVIGILRSERSLGCGKLG